MDNFADAMLRMLPKYERESSQFNTLLQCYAGKLNELGAQMSKINQNLIISTASELLEIHERDLGISAPPTLSLVLRREQIIAKYRSAFDQTTEEAIISVAESFANGSIEFMETETPGLYTIKFTSQLGVPYNIDGLKEAVRNMLPAHLDVLYLFVYNTWEWALDSTWASAGVTTWFDFRQKEV